MLLKSDEMVVRHQQIVWGAFEGVMPGDYPTRALIEVERLCESKGKISEVLVTYREIYVPPIAHSEEREYVWTLRNGEIEKDGNYDFDMRNSQYQSRSVLHSHLRRTLLGNPEVKALIKKMLAVTAKMQDRYLQSLGEE